MQSPLPWKELLGDRAPSLRSTAAMLTSLTALAATSLIAAPSVAVPLSEACVLRRTQAHHSEGLDTWNSAYPRPTRDLDAVLVFLSFPDAAPLTTPAELTADHFPATSEFFERASYGKFALRPHPRRKWLEMPRPSTAYAIRRDWSAERRAAYLEDALATADPHVDFSRYDIVYFVADPHAPGVDSDATKVVNLETPLEVDGTGLRRVVTVFERHPPDRLVLAHETGHVFDLPDLYHRPADGKGDWDTYVGDWDLMGSQFALAPDLFAWHKWKLGWLEPRQVTCVRGTGSTRLTLEAVGAGPKDGYEGEGGKVGEVGNAGGGGRVAGDGGGGGGPVADSGVGGGSGVGVGGGLGVGVGVGGGAAGARAFGVGRGAKLAVVPTGPDSALGIEARGAVGNDGSVCTEGVLVYRIRSGAESGTGPIEVLDAHPRTEACREESVYPPLADAPVGVGESFTVPGEAVRVAVEGRTASGAWTVRITTGR
ncbi:M6 family metalloprotease domain-containing protein [Streptomyces sp. CA-210063]|uniref:M6 family metalloprotease domain-containing protein n=1 Tax=Streptomyces sp. CA-210063 TaxID=2801029 RepID=UPI00214CA3F4|nr:M6 family metalloprotease domain-containing protein [Streptomyces sp. CA-210063]UUU33690.1 M6 family metalloprotease domain-containing protein [Streptomyces sp. CA-210063]